MPSIVTCSVCGKSHKVTPSRALVYKVCSRACMGKLASKNKSENVTGTCEVCGAQFKTKASHKSRRRTCSRLCMGKLKSIECVGKGNHQYGKRGAERGNAFKGGKRISSWGYILVGVDGGKYEFEHRLIMERIIGRKLLRTEHVHHINGNKQDNRIENLSLMTKSEHQSLHNKEKPMPRDHKTQRFIQRAQKL